MFCNCVDIADGDLVFFRKHATGNSDFGEAVADVGGGGNAVIHVALLIENKKCLLHADPDKGVIIEDIKPVLDTLCPDCYEIYRVQADIDTRLKALSWARSKIGCPYNDIFSSEMKDSAGDEAYYCSQLVVEAYRFAGIIDINPPYKMSFADKQGNILPYWLNYYESRSLKVPEGEPGSHPASLIQSNYLSLRYKKTINQAMSRFCVPKVLDSALHFINGARVAPKANEFFDVIQPRNGEVLTVCGCASNELISEAIDQARRVQPQWKRAGAQNRGVVLRKAADIIRENEEGLARMETIDCGKPIEESRFDIRQCADCFDFFAGCAHSLAGSHFPLEDNKYAYTHREPWGVIGAIGVWNYPMQTASWKIAPALMCGNAVVYKPSPLAPVTSLLLAEILQNAGLPDGLLSVVQGDGKTGKTLCEHEGIDKVTFTGSSKTGAKILSSCSLEMRIKPSTMELGGKSAMIVFADADIEMAVTGALMANFFSQGEVCSNAAKVLVHRSVYEKFRKRVVEATKKITVGDPLSSDTKMGALISMEHLQKVKAFIEESSAEGANLLCGGQTYHVKGLENGFYLTPAVMDNINQTMRIYKEEVFGAVMLLLPFDTYEEALRLANDTPFGLAAGVFTKDLNLAYAATLALNAGNIYVNTFNDTNTMVPFGGMKQSGFGRENGTAALEAFSQIKSVFVNASNSLENPFQ